MENDKNINTMAAVGEALKKIKELEEGDAHLKEEMSKLMVSGEDIKKSDRQWSNSVSPVPAATIAPLRRETRSAYASSGNGVGAAVDGGEVIGDSAVKRTESQYMNVLQSMGQSVHMMNVTGQIIYWNQMAQNLYGYTVDEALGKTALDIIIGPNYWALATLMVQRTLKGESWSGEFPVRNKRWETFTVVTTLSPSRDERGTVNGIISVSTDACPFQESRPRPSIDEHQRISSAKFGHDPHQPLQTALASKISNLASKVKSKIKTGENKINHDGRSGHVHYDIAPCKYKQDAPPDGANTLRVDSAQSPSGAFFPTGETFTRKTTTESGGGHENEPGLHKTLSKKAEAWMGRKGILWPWKGNEGEGDTFEGRRGHFGWPWLHNDQEQKSGSQMSFGASMKVENQVYESASTSNTNGAIGSWFSSCGGSGSTNINSVTKVDIYIDDDNLDINMSWDDLIVGEQIGQGSCGTVYHALWYGSDVAVKVFPEQEYPDDVIPAFRKEVCLMKRLRHPNILLFMGAVTSPHHLCIVTEFLPRGSLFGLLQRNTTKLDWRHRVHMAMDIALGMSYLHHCHPPIIHRDLKSSNLLVDENWTVKVGDFGLSRIKHETYLTASTGKGTPEWMAPEVLRNGQADEKSDVYSYGVVLWELATEKIPWDNLNSMQVIGAVGFMNQRLEIPNDVDPQWASLIESCCSSLLSTFDLWETVPGRNAEKMDEESTNEESTIRRDDEYDEDIETYMESTGSNVIDSPGGTRYWIPVVVGVQVPVLFSYFESLDEAIHMYAVYAEAAGFDIRKSTDRKTKDKTIVLLKYILCNKAGKSPEQNVNTLDEVSSRGRKRLRVKCTECPALIKFKYLFPEKRYQVVGFEERHNHPLVEKENMDFLLSRRQLKFPEMQFIHRARKNKIGAMRAHKIKTVLDGGYSNTRGKPVDWKNYMKSVQQVVGPKDAQFIIDKMNSRKEYCPNFSFEYEQEGKKLLSMFWADEMSKVNFSEFGDVLSFDATFRTNKLVSRFSRVNKLVWDAQIEPHEFEEEWKTLINELNLQDNGWLTSIYEIRDKWISAYFKGVRMSGLMKTTSRSESINSFFNTFVNECDTFLGMVFCFDSAMEKQRYIQRSADHDDCNAKTSYLTPHPLEVHASSVYTDVVFRKVQKYIFRGAWFCSVTNRVNEDGCEVFSIEQKGDETVGVIGEFKVVLNGSEHQVVCTCNKFLHFGVLCCHVFKVFIEKGIKKIPNMYIMRRWRKDLIHPRLLRGVNLDVDEEFERDRTEAYSLLDECLQLLRNDKSRRCSFIEDIGKQKKLLEDAVSNGSHVRSKHDTILSFLGVSEPDSVDVEIPNRIRNKGCGKSRRLLSMEEKLAKKGNSSRQCQTCFLYGHDTRTCPDKGRKK